MTDTAKKELLPAMSDFEALFQRQLEIGTLPPIEAIQQQLKAWETQNPTAQELKIS